MSDEHEHIEAAEHGSEPDEPVPAPKPPVRNWHDKDPGYPGSPTRP